MDTIKTYLENMFASLPRTAQIKELKNNILANMEEKYLELKNQGKSENEAIGIVISEFGNIDELVIELGLNKGEMEAEGRAVDDKEVKNYISLKRVAGIKIAIGVFLCILAPTILILIYSFVDAGLLSVPESTGTIALFVLVAIAVAIFIQTGLALEPVKYMEEGVLLPYDVEKELREELNRFMPRFGKGMVVGVCMIILSPIALFVTYEGSELTTIIGVIILLSIVNIAVVLFILLGTQKESYERLLKTGDYTPKKKEENKVIGAVASIVWPLAVIVFLVTGFIYQLWYINWIIFPIVGLLFGMFSAAYSIINEKSKA